jgi:hypothetical protein
MVTVDYKAIVRGVAGDDQRPGHREVLAVSDRVVFFRGGNYVAT